MARTLGCLVASMTVGAALLDWFQPNRLINNGPSIELIARGSGTWTSIRVAPQRAGGAGKVSDAHFCIDREGNCNPTDYWINQRRFGNESVVRVGLVAAPNSNEVALPQWWAAQELIAALQQQWPIPENRIQLDDTLALPRMASAERSGANRP
jgi:hypothetical protein